MRSRWAQKNPRDQKGNMRILLKGLRMKRDICFEFFIISGAVECIWTYYAIKYHRPVFASRQFEPKCTWTETRPMHNANSFLISTRKKVLLQIAKKSVAYFYRTYLLCVQWQSWFFLWWMSASLFSRLYRFFSFPENKQFTFWFFFASLWLIHSPVQRCVKHKLYAIFFE